MAHWHVLWSCSASTRVVLPGRLDGVYLMTKDPKVLLEKRVNHNGQRFVLFWDGSVKSFDDVQFDRLKRDGLSMRRIASGDEPASRSLAALFALYDVDGPAFAPDKQTIVHYLSQLSRKIDRAIGPRPFLERAKGRGARLMYPLKITHLDR